VGVPGGNEGAPDTGRARVWVRGVQTNWIVAWKRELLNEESVEKARKRPGELPIRWFEKGWQVVPYFASMVPF
jgi:hypothetical protein